MHPLLTPAIALIAGIAILVQPKFLNYIVAIYLIVAGVLGLPPLKAYRYGFFDGDAVTG